jgi:uroporphyrinogen decarboxylase
MRQAGRILPEYRAVRNSVSGFIELAQTPELAAEVTIQPVDILKVDAAIIFSDILVIPEAMGLPYEMVEKRGPWFPNTIKNSSDINRLRIADGVDDLSYVIEAIKIVKKNLNGRVPLIGFAGAPWTIFFLYDRRLRQQNIFKSQGHAVHPARTVPPAIRFDHGEHHQLFKSPNRGRGGFGSII